MHSPIYASHLRADSRYLSQLRRCGFLYRHLSRPILEVLTISTRAIDTIQLLHDAIDVTQLPLSI